MDPRRTAPRGMQPHIQMSALHMDRANKATGLDVRQPYLQGCCVEKKDAVDGGGAERRFEKSFMGPDSN